MFRTLQSGYSELIGLYPPAYSSQSLTTKEVQNLIDGKALPPIKVRRSKDINAVLEKSAVFNGTVQIPMYAYLNPSLQDDVNF